MLELDFGSFHSSIEFPNTLDSALSEEHGLIVCDRNTQRYAPAGSETVVLEPGEAYKQWDAVERIIEAASKRSLARDDTIVGLGGGVVCDIAAFAASIYMRGCRLVLAPTTLLSMIDAAIGGKTGVDYRGAKNFIGTFYPANRILIVTSVLKTLSDREYRSGLAEAIKHGMLADSELFDLLEEDPDAVLRRDTSIVDRAVAGSVEVKGRIVQADLKESGERAHLNLGHTFGHALESATGFTTVTHGEAVAWGMVKAMKLGLALGMTDHNYAVRVQRLLMRYEYPVFGVAFKVNDVLAAMKNDKKRKSGSLRFIIQRSLCDTTIVQPDESAVRAVLEDDSPIE